MERVTFLLEPSQERLSAQLNPETLEVRRRAGLVRRTLPGGAVNAHSDQEDALLHTGGGRTEVELDLLFDLDLAGWSGECDDVRDLTEPFFQLTDASDTAAGRRRVPQVRFLWGKRWNMLAVVEAVSQRLERFDAGGAPRRSWMRLRLVRIPELRAAAGSDAAKFPEGPADRIHGRSESEFDDSLADDTVLPADETSIGPVDTNWHEALPGGSRLDQFLEELERRTGGSAGEERLA